MYEQDIKIARMQRTYMILAQAATSTRPIALLIQTRKKAGVRVAG